MVQPPTDFLYNAFVRGGDIIDRKPIHHHGRKLKLQETFWVNWNVSENSKCVRNCRLIVSMICLFENVSSFCWTETLRRLLQNTVSHLIMHILFQAAGSTSKYSIRGVARFPLGPLLELGTLWNISWSGGSWNSARTWRCFALSFFSVQVCVKHLLKRKSGPTFWNWRFPQKVKSWGDVFSFYVFQLCGESLGIWKLSFTKFKNSRKLKKNIVSLPYLMLNSWSLHVIIVLIFQEFTRPLIFTHWQAPEPNHAPMVEMITVYLGLKLFHPHCDWG